MMARNDANQRKTNSSMWGPLVGYPAPYQYETRPISSNVTIAVAVSQGMSLRSNGVMAAKPCGRAPAERLARGVPDHAGLAPQLAFPADLGGPLLCRVTLLHKIGARGNMLKFRSIGLSDYSVLKGRQRIGRIRLATERIPGVWLWSVTVHLPGGLSCRTAPFPIARPWPQ